MEKRRPANRFKDGKRKPKAALTLKLHSNPIIIEHLRPHSNSLTEKLA